MPSGLLVQDDASTGTSSEHAVFAQNVRGKLVFCATSSPLLSNTVPGSMLETIMGSSTVSVVGNAAADDVDAAVVEETGADGVVWVAK